MDNRLGIFGGTILILFGLWMLGMMIMSIADEGFNSIGTPILFFYGALPIALGFYILLNLNKENKIEKRKDKK